MNKDQANALLELMADCYRIIKRANDAEAAAAATAPANGRGVPTQEYKAPAEA